MERKIVGTIMKNVNNSRSINCTFIKIEILAVLDILNNFQLVMEFLTWTKVLESRFEILVNKLQYQYFIIYIKNYIIKFLYSD
jgi:hypothetical protein